MAYKWFEVDRGGKVRGPEPRLRFAQFLGHMERHHGTCSKEGMPDTGADFKLVLSQAILIANGEQVLIAALNGLR